MHTISAAESQKYAHMRQMNPHCTPTHEYKHKQQKINSERSGDEGRARLEAGLQSRSLQPH